MVFPRKTIRAIVTNSMTLTSLLFIQNEPDSHWHDQGIVRMEERQGFHCFRRSMHDVRNMMFEWRHTFCRKKASVTLDATVPVSVVTGRKTVS